MKYCCLFTFLLLTISCTLKGKKYSGEAIGQYDPSASSLLYFPDVKAVGFKDSIPLYSMATILSCLDEKPLANYANTSVIRFIYCPSMSRPKLVRFDNQQIVFKEVMSEPHDLELINDTIRLSIQERIAFHAIQDYRDSVNSKSADTARMRASNPFVTDKDYFYFLIYKQFAPEETSTPYKLTVTAVDQTPLRQLLEKAGSLAIGKCRCL